jgi:ribosomal protein S18 acetylase RimI-like enzyme
MASSLTSVEFSESYLPQVQGFDCGDEEWSLAINDWIRGDASNPRSALSSIRVRGNRVLLYKDPGGQIVGVGSVGDTPRKWPRPDGRRAKLAIVPTMAVHRQHKGNGYSYEIMGDLIAIAQCLPGLSVRVLALDVQQENTVAFHLYKKIGFVESGYRFDRQLPIGTRTFIEMFLII